MANVTGRKRRKRERLGGYGTSYIGSLTHHEPDKAKALILEAIDRSRGRMVSAACELGIDRRHLQRLCWQLQIWPEVDQVRDAWKAFQKLPPSVRLVSQPGLTRPSNAAVP